MADRFADMPATVAPTLPLTIVGSALHGVELGRGEHVVLYDGAVEDGLDPVLERGLLVRGEAARKRAHLLGAQQPLHEHHAETRLADGRILYFRSSWTAP